MNWVTVGYVLAIGALAAWVWFSRRSRLKEWMRGLLGDHRVLHIEPATSEASATAQDP